MTAELFSERLDWFKQNEKPEVILLVGDDQILIKIIITWSNIKLSHPRELIDDSGLNENQNWEWLWENTKFNLAELKTKAGISISKDSLERRVNHLISNRIIYPDGTINSYIQRYLREKVLGLFASRKYSSAGEHL